MPKVVLIHGLYSNPKRWAKEKAEFESMGYEVVTVSYKTGRPVDMNREIDMQVARHQDADIFVGHSYGGMYLDQNTRIPGDRIVTINSPGARRGHNFQGVFDPFNVIDPETAYSASESRTPTSHWNHISANDIIDARNKPNLDTWANDLSRISKYNQWRTRRDRKKRGDPYRDYWRSEQRKAKYRGTYYGWGE